MKSYSLAFYNKQGDFLSRALTELDNVEDAQLSGEVDENIDWFLEEADISEWRRLEDN